MNNCTAHIYTCVFLYGILIHLKLLITLITFKLTFSGMDALMNSQATGCSTIIAALIIFERSISGMCSFMESQITICGIRIAALVAFEWPLARMFTFINN